MIAMWLFSSTILSFAILAGLCILLATWYDVRRGWVMRYSTAQSKKVSAITAIITVNPGSTRLRETISSVKRLGGKRVDIVVAVPVELPKEERRQLRGLARSIHIYRARISHSRQALTALAYKRSRRNELVILLNADTPLVSGTLQSTSRQLLSSSSMGGIHIGQGIVTPASMGELVEVIAVLSQRFVSKALCATGLYWSDSTAPGQLVRREAVVKTSRHRVAFDSGTAMLYSPNLWSRSLRFLGYGLSIVMMLMMMYASVLAARLKTVEPLLLGWSVVVIWLGSIFWLDDSLRLRQRLESLLYIPIAYFVIPVRVLVTLSVRLILRRTF